MKSKLENFKDRIDLDKIICPLCHQGFLIVDNSLKCSNNHLFNFNKKGYLNLEPQKHLKHYDEDLFIARHIIMQGEYYQPLFQEIKDIIERLKLNSIIDIGCGEGSLLSYLNSIESYGVDLSLAAIRVANKYFSNINFIVGDLANLPFKDNSFDGILNVLTPANYQEFKRINKNNGYLIKVIAQKEYLKEIREITTAQSKDNDNVVRQLEKHYKIIEEIPLKYQMSIKKEHRKMFLRMTPLLFNIDDNFIEELSNQLENITIDLLIIVARN